MVHQLGHPRQNSLPVCPHACWIRIFHPPVSGSQALLILVSVLRVLERKGVPSQTLYLLLAPAAAWLSLCPIPEALMLLQICLQPPSEKADVFWTSEPRAAALCCTVNLESLTICFVVSDTHLFFR